MFNKDGLFSKKDEIVRRRYFVSERPITFQQNNNQMNPRALSRAAFIAGVLKEKVNLITIFKGSLKF